MVTPWFKKMQRYAEYGALYGATSVFKKLSPKNASNFGAFLAGVIKKIPRRKHIVQRNLEIAFPKATTLEKERWFHETFETLGRFLGEYVHLSELNREDCEIEGEEIWKDARSQDRPIIVLAAHLAHLELPALCLRFLGEKNLCEVYRPRNNPYVDEFFLAQHQRLVDFPIPKSGAIGYHLVRALKKKHPIIILADHKENRGVPIPFLGGEAMTSSVIPRLALRHNALLIPIQGIRLAPFQYRVKIYPPITHDDDSEKTLKRINALIGTWIEENPGQYWWLHRRYPKELYNEKHGSRDC